MVVVVVVELTSGVREEGDDGRVEGGGEGGKGSSAGAISNKDQIFSNEEDFITQENV